MDIFREAVPNESGTEPERTLQHAAFDLAVHRFNSVQDATIRIEHDYHEGEYSEMVIIVSFEVK